MFDVYIVDNGLLIDGMEAKMKRVNRVDKKNTMAFRLVLTDTNYRYTTSFSYNVVANARSTARNKFRDKWYGSICTFSVVLLPCLVRSSRHYTMYWCVEYVVYNLLIFPTSIWRWELSWKLYMIVIILMLLCKVWWIN